MVAIIPTLDKPLLSDSKFADAGYTVVYDKAEVNFLMLTPFTSQKRLSLWAIAAHAQGSGTFLSD